ncbi:MAG TPA: S41 family peptidase [Clostridiales bacterium]|nr:S41 family peptidase [Clostridiales bacterium]
MKGKVLVYYSVGEKRNMLAVTDIKSGKFTDIETEMYVVDAELSSDGNYAFCQIMEPGLYRTDLYLYDLKKGTKEKIYTSTDWTSNFRLSPDGEFIFYTREGDIFRSGTKYLSDFYFDKDKWKDIFDKNDKKKKDEKEPEPQYEPVNKDLRLTESRLIKNPGSNYILSITKNKDIYYINSFEEKQILRKTDFEAKNDEVITEFKSQNIKDFVLCDSTMTLFYLQDGKIRSFETAQKKTKDTPFNLKYDYSRQEIYWKVFDEAHSILARWFYDPLMHGVDWKKKGSDFSAYLSVNLDGGSFGSIICEMVGDLNSSHTGFYPAKEPDVASLPVASVGAEFDLKSRLEKGLTVGKVFDSSALKTVHGITAGDILLSVDGITITPFTDIYELLVNKTGEKIKLEFLKNGKSMTAEIKGLESDYRLKYETWVNEREMMTDRISGGKIGYAHIQGMSEGPLQQFIEDIFAKNFDKEALIIDVRYNGGGYTHDQLIEMLTKRQYALTSERWTGNMKMKAPSDIWDKPSVVLINNRSYSDAEIFPSLYREMGLGKIIGTPTTGDVIGTTHHVLMDGSSMRLPKVGWFRKDGTNMEGNGVQPDIYIEPTFTQLLNDDDPELKKAVELLTEEIK